MVELPLRDMGNVLVQGAFCQISGERQVVRLDQKTSGHIVKLLVDRREQCIQQSCPDREEPVRSRSVEPFLHLPFGLGLRERSFFEYRAFPACDALKDVHPVLHELK